MMPNNGQKIRIVCVFYGSRKEMRENNQVLGIFHIPLLTLLACNEKLFFLILIAPRHPPVK